jgi:DAACS family dicarboxylate/amino acid:cation (Na+ or H+) symporter
VSIIAVLLGITLVNVIGPGVVSIRPCAASTETAGRASAITRKAKHAGVNLFVQIIPDNPLKAAASGDMLGWMFFSLMIGVGLCLVRLRPRRNSRTLSRTLRCEHEAD